MSPSIENEKATAYTTATNSSSKDDTTMKGSKEDTTSILGAVAVTAAAVADCSCTILPAEKDFCNTINKNNDDDDDDDDEYQYCAWEYALQGLILMLIRWGMALPVVVVVKREEYDLSSCSCCY